MSLVSIIIPIYNVEAYLDACVESVRKQTYPNLEILLIEDGSPDRCGEMCDAYAREDERIRVIHKKNEGLSATRNLGIQLAKGEYLLFVDSDDYIDKGLVERILELAQEKKADIVMFDYVSVEQDGTLSERFSMPLPEEEVICAEQIPSLIQVSCSAWNKMYRTQFLRDSGVDFPVGYIYEDMGTVPKWLVLAKRVVYTRRVLYYYRKRETSIMHSQAFEKNYPNRTAMLEGLFSFFEERNLLQQYRDELEYLMFEHAYYVPSKEVLYHHGKWENLKEYRTYALSRCPKLARNPYLKKMPRKERFLWFLLRIRAYPIMQLCSCLRSVCERMRSRWK
jgi:glycosyltransferase involved in cell wall biosynthesis